MVSVIIPAFNEETCIGQTLETLLGVKGRFEVLVVDGHSADTTRNIAGRFCPVVTSPPGRAVQMNRGVQEAAGDVFLFLHADVGFPPSGILSIERTLADPKIVGGNFDIAYEGASLVSRVFTLINRWRRPFGIFYGDSGIFVRREVFDRLGGFRTLPLMEDYDFARRLVKAGKTVCLKDPLLVSARRWEEHGLWRTMATWFFLHVLFYSGLPLQTLAHAYPPIRRSSRVGARQQQRVSLPASPEPVQLKQLQR
ncbi:MAG: TIGR04283 family arsenosugar biosynthesis glycosyltransferase [Acidobacteria bacterium]|nr:TIGR04283 family arsenosugar biosynthesis glycosyltransferase [Acidobacteriota bacterium]